MKNVKVSVVMPTFNSARFISDAIDSILSQTFQDFEFIIVDDGSTDGTARLLSEYAQIDKRIKVISNEKNKGIVFALNRGLQACRGDYIVRMDADDIAIKNRIEKQVAAMDADKDICALGGSLSYIDALGNDLGIIRHCELNKLILTKTPLLHPTVIIRHSSLIQNGLYYQEKYRFAEDYFLWLQLSRIGKISAINDVVLQYRLNNQATKIKKLKSSILATLRVKKDAIFILKIKPTLSDIIMICIESLLLLLPSSLTLSLYFKINFGKRIKINL